MLFQIHFKRVDEDNKSDQPAHQKKKFMIVEMAFDNLREAIAGINKGGMIEATEIWSRPKDEDDRRFRIISAEYQIGFCASAVERIGVPTWKFEREPA